MEANLISDKLRNQQQFTFIFQDYIINVISRQESLCFFYRSFSSALSFLVVLHKVRPRKFLKCYNFFNVAFRMIFEYTINESKACRSSRLEYDERVCLTSASDGVLQSVEYRLLVRRVY